MATINAAVNCKSSRVIYCITCTKPRCRSQYCGKTVSEFKSRMYQHRVSVTGTDGKTRPDLEKAVGAHFNGPGHKVSDMSVTILEKVWNKDPMFLTVREELRPQPDFIVFLLATNQPCPTDTAFNVQ